ncbi:pentatricopeptide repeat-containing protein At4g14050, mitochondrial isoform X1 [Selaginella moellendorffii]|uniref:pentatricopeptide repeat-containing protein At4g14050, mitochondrial isoform X1 n=1 Tax=Selaginella moellendorffii TaxID=88036 RepID=UPI000D1C8C6C|nr:pentatricopeptide repeat-containing protein At4g14050, mitochondrial isoform X1 [Selaginella moellendorffii]XP_024538664.1 pentatricopeptide repeat-containing protein At4g14050, mitochondrial isoform X1 [Selaginella moellendorffii]|eukprot:XP_024538663.1 pentatricopeptide repeat-containing protein At4g14050, mitochondrial isoform X1 [Selaginella moellendorffii]
MYAKCGSMPDAQKVFDLMPVRDAVPWNALILGYFENGDSALALRSFSAMQRSSNAAPNARTFTAALMACTKLAASDVRSRVDGKLVSLKYLETGKIIHSQAVAVGVDSQLYLASTLVDMYAKCGSMDDSRKVFERMPVHNVVSWTSLVLGYAENDEPGVALGLFFRMLSLGYEPDARAFVAALTACASLAEKEQGMETDGRLLKLESLQRGMELHSLAVKLSCWENIFVASTLVSVYANCGSLADARMVFDRVPRHDAVLRTAMVLGYVENDENKLAIDLFSCMQTGKRSSNPGLFTAALTACANLATAEAGKQVSERPVKLSCLESVMSIHSQSATSGYDSEIFLANTLIDTYSKCGSMVDARRVFDSMVRYDIVSWTALILGYADNGEEFLALENFSCLSSSGCFPDARAFVAVLGACGSVVALETGRRIQADIYRRGLENYDAVANALVDFYGKCGSLLLAEHLFDTTSSDKDCVQWNALLVGYGYQGNAGRVFDLFEIMQREGVPANGITFLSLLNACSHAGLVDKAKSIFEEMLPRYGVSPNPQHYTCLIDLLGRSNHLDCAVETLKIMPFEADAVTWTAILAASKKWKNIQLGRLAFETLLTFDASDGAAYALMGNLYGSLGRWEDKKGVLAKMREAGAWKEAGQSWWNDRDGKVHRFMAHESSHPQIKEINAKLKKLVGEMKEHGYVTDAGSAAHKFSTDEKMESSLCGHSERLAIGCALINSPPGSPIRIGKNLRVCDDCHNATAIISRIEKRTIICRDGGRFHTFEDGKCSCGNFW